MEYILLLAILLQDGSIQYMSLETGSKQECTQLAQEVVDTFKLCYDVKQWVGTCKVQGWNES